MFFIFLISIKFFKLAGYPSHKAPHTLPVDSDIRQTPATASPHALSMPSPSPHSNLVKPDLVAPGVNVTAAAVGGNYAQFTGTSFATPFVTGGAALMMEWGIVKGNDAYLYGEKVKAYLRRGAKPLPGFTEYPNPQVGYGALCVMESIPG